MARPRKYPAANAIAAQWIDADTDSAGSQGPRNPAGPRPPHGAAMIRPSLKTGGSTVAPRQDAEVLANAAKYAYLQEGESGMSISLGIAEDLFEDLACEVAVEDGVVRATFSVGDDVNLRRLLEAEKGRLRAALEARGMRKVEVVIDS